MGIVLLVVWGYMCEHGSSMIDKVVMDSHRFVHLSGYVHRYFMVDISGNESLIKRLWHLDISDSGIGFNNCMLMRLWYLDDSAPNWVAALVSERCCIASSGMERLSADIVGLSDQRLGQWCCVSSSSIGRLCHVVKRVVHSIGAGMGCHHGGGNER